MGFKKTFIVPEVVGKNGSRTACRGVIIDEKWQIPLLFDGYKKYYKLPGGGIEGDEDKIEAFRREIKEESGCEIDSIKEIGTVLEESPNWQQLSYCFIGNVISKGEPHFTEKEIERCYQLKWISLDEALSLMRDVLQKTEGGKMQQERDLFILENSVEELSKL